LAGGVTPRLGSAGSPLPYDRVLSVPVAMISYHVLAKTYTYFSAEMLTAPFS
jgi:hypothetical protein